MYRKHLTLPQKIEVIKERESGKSVPTVANKYRISQTQVKTLIKKKEEIKEEFNQNPLLKRKRMKKSTKFDEVNDLVWKFFTDMKARNLYVSGPMLKEQALKFATDLKLPKFSASNGWLESFRSRYGIILKKKRKIDEEKKEAQSENIVSVSEAGAYIDGLKIFSAQKDSAEPLNLP
ncbi:hypothetical protein LAZ67_11001659 [Cordylochernes scorpioides]|uniref:HTH CENPB-type domain-containing protein n=1 Tax=Cordylochernes scorpioides TaxID=51811 RepID=A0ABY6KYL4_9ARAC|nr:hypothetical protein LAZ67_11001659 [Cordylochernes scorpioides]